jgi:hypothetical protein
MGIYRVYVEEERMRTTEFYVEADSQEEADEHGHAISDTLNEDAWTEDVVDTEFSVKPIEPKDRDKGYPTWVGGESGGWEGG